MFIFIAFWIKESVVYEQPRVVYRYLTVFQLQGIDSATGDVLSLFYSTNAKVNELFSGHLRTPIVKSAELDDNHDGIVDRIEIGMKMPLKDTESITKFTAMVYHDVELKDRARYKFDAVSYVTTSNPVSMGSLYIDGDISLRQTWPLDYKGGYHLPYENDELIPIDLDISATDLSMVNILGASAARNLSTTFSPSYIYSVPAIGKTDIDAPVFNATLVIRAPKQPVRYTPGASEVLKFAWIQYMSFFIVIAFVLFRLNAFIFRHQLVYAYGVSDIVVEKMD